MGGRQKHPCVRSSSPGRAPDPTVGRPRLMTRPVAARPPGADSQYCERCGDVAGEATSLRRVGLTRCPSCSVFACQRCWAKAAGACPGCGFSPVGASVVAAFRSKRDPVTSRPLTGATAATGAAAMARPAPRRADRSAALAVLVTIVALSVVGFALAGPLRPSNGVEGAVGTPGPVAVRSIEPSSGSSPVVVAGGDGATPSPTAQRPTARPTARPAPGVASTPRPNRTPGSTPQPTPRSTPRPTPRPTVAPPPTPTPCVAVAPQLVGQKKSNATRLWHDAGFTGSVTTLPGHGNYRIATQNRTAGNTYVCGTSLTVGP